MSVYRENAAEDGTHAQQLPTTKRTLHFQGIQSRKVERNSSLNVIAP